MVVNGQSVLLKFSQLSGLEKYIPTKYLLQGNQIHTYLEIKDIHTFIVGGDSSEILRDFHHKKNLTSK